MRGCNLLIWHGVNNNERLKFKHIWRKSRIVWTETNQRSKFQSTLFSCDEKNLFTISQKLQYPSNWGKNLPNSSVTSKKSPNVYKSCTKMISLEKLKILTPLKIPQECRFGQSCPKSNKFTNLVTLPNRNNVSRHHVKISPGGCGCSTVSKNSFVLKDDRFLHFVE